MVVRVDPIYAQGYDDVDYIVVVVVVFITIFIVGVGAAIFVVIINITFTFVVVVVVVVVVVDYRRTSKNGVSSRSKSFFFIITFI
jgi:hypothetical protein